MYCFFRQCGLHLPVSSEISDLTVFTPCAYAQSSILHAKYAEKTDDFRDRVWCLGKCVELRFEKEK